MLTFTDNGAGMNSETLHKMCSFGYCEKVEIKGHKVRLYRFIGIDRGSPLDIMAMDSRVDR
jgi:hypothetical protein